VRIKGKHVPSNPGGARFLAPVQAGPGAQPASCTMGTESFPGVKRSGRGVDHPPPTSTEVKERVELYLYSPSGSSWPVIGRNFTRPRDQEVHQTAGRRREDKTYVEAWLV
jgi:hypothetical protein